MCVCVCVSVCVCGTTLLQAQIAELRAAEQVGRKMRKSNETQGKVTKNKAVVHAQITLSCEPPSRYNCSQKNNETLTKHERNITKITKLTKTNEKLTKN